MADNVADVEIVNLPETAGVTGDTVFPGYVPGALKPAQKITAEQLKTFFGQEIAVVAYGDALADVEYQNAAGKFLILKDGGYFALLCEATSSAFVFRTTVNMIGVNRRSLYEYTLDRSSGAWDSGVVYPEYAFNKVNTIDSSSTVMQYPSAKAVYDLAQSLVIGGGGGGGLPGADGEDGGYYIPNVTQIDQHTMQVSFIPTKDDMAQAPTRYIDLPQGPQGQPGSPGSPGSPGMDGEDGKSAYEYAQDGGYTGTEAEFAEKLAQPIPLDWFGVGTAIPSGADLNTYKTDGKFYAETEAIGQSLLNRPDGMNTNFVMWVFRRTTSDIYSQLMLTLSGKMYIRSSNSKAWRAWVAYTTSAEIEELTEEIRNQLLEELGDIDTALDAIIAMQESYIGGEGA